MIVTDSKGGWMSKVNFTDSNDVFVGYDMGQYCCEQAGWFISSKSTYAGEDDILVNANTDGYVFDTSFFEHVDVAENALDEGDQVCFKLTKENDCDIYLHLYNTHNGYYFHGFEAKVGGEVWQEGSL